MLKKRAKGVQTLVKCEECGEKVNVLFDDNGKRVCKKCLDNSGK